MQENKCHLFFDGTQTAHATDRRVASPPPGRANQDEPPLIRLANLMNWVEIERSFGAHFVSSRGRPALSPRLVAGLLYLQHANDASDEAVVAT